jgi:acetyltransferase-like isoleucine patch superfamily enzyme
MIEDEKTKPISKIPLAEQLHTSGTSALKRYQTKAFGSGGFLSFLEYELATFLFGSLSGGIGYFLRKQFYRRIFKSIGKSVILGKAIALRHPQRMSLGNRVAIDDFVLLDAGGTGPEGMILGDDVIISRNCVVQGKTGPVVVGEKTDIGCNCVLSSVTGIYIGKSVLIAGNCYIGGGRYKSERLDIPMLEQGLYSKGPVVIGDDVWLGAGVIVLDGAKIGTGAIVGAGAVVTKDLPDYAIAVGAPAVTKKYRGG